VAAQANCRALHVGVRVSRSYQNRLPTTVSDQGQIGIEAQARGVDLNLIAFGRAGDRPAYAAGGFAPRSADGMAVEDRVAEEIEIVTVAGATDVDVEITLFRRHIVCRPAFQWLACAVRQIDRAGAGPSAHQPLERSCRTLRMTDLAKEQSRQHDNHAARQLSGPPRQSWYD
jgi:hypothetical protein